MRKALILGAGGTGASVIQRICDLVEWRKNSNIKKFQNIQFLEIDTFPDSLLGYKSNFLDLGVSGDEVDTFKRDKSSGHHKWAGSDEISAVTDGAGQTRMKGKFAFLYHYNYIRNEVEVRLNELYNTIIEDGKNKQKTKIYIVANSVSGTGSGCFVDYGYLVRDIIAKNNVFRNDEHLNITLLLTLPSRMDVAGYYLRNSFYALQELNYFMSGNPYSIENAAAPGVMINAEASVKPFDYVYLVGSKGSRKNFEVGELENIVGEYIYNDVFSPSADKRDEKRDDMNKYLWQTDKLGYNQCYMTFGFSTIEYPAVQISKAATYKYISDSLETWLASSAPPPRYDYKKLLLEDSDIKTEGNIYNYLIKEVKVKSLNGSEYTIDVRKMLEDLKKKAYQAYRDDGYATRHISRLIETIDKGFEQGSSYDSYDKGTVNIAISENKKELEDYTRPESGWAGITKNVLLDTMFFNQDYPRTDGIHLAEQLLKEVNIRLDNILNKETGSESQADIRRKINAKLAEIEDIRSDKLLKIGGLYKSPIEERSRECMRRIDEYIDLRISVAALLEAKNLAEMAKDSLEEFENDINRFKAYIIKWQSNLKADYMEVITPKDSNGHIVMRNEIDKQADILIKSTKLTVSDIVRGSLSKTFRNSLMKGSTFTEKSRLDVINIERSSFIGKQKTNDVIEAFINEEENKGDEDRRGNRESIGTETLGALKVKGDLFIDIRPGDPDVIQDEKIMLNKWFFYPNGGNIDNASKVPDNKFAELLMEHHMITDWSKQSQDSFDNNTIMFLQERGCFPLRLLNLLNDIQMTRAIDETKGYDDNIFNTFLSRLDIDFMPLTEINSEKLNDVKKLLLISIAAGTLIMKGQEFVYNKTDAKKNLFGDIMETSISLPNKYKNAVYKLYENEDAQETLRTKNNEMIANNKPEFLIQLNGFLHNISTRGLRLNDVLKDTREIFAIIADNYIKVMDGMLEEWNELFPDDAINEKTSMHFEFITRGETDTKKHPNVGWYCKLCGMYLSDENINGQADYNILPKLKKSHYCGR